MKISCYLFCILFLSFYTDSNAQSPSERNNPKPLGTTSAPLGFFEYLPADYATKTSGNFPLVIFLHGLGELGNGTSELGKVLAQGAPRMVEYEDKDFPFVLLTPQAPREWYYITPTINDFIEFAKTSYKVDSDRIYVTGLSMGGSGTWFYGGDFSKQVAAIVPICGQGEFWNPCNYTNVPIWAFHNAEDDRVPVERSIQMVDTIRSCGGNPYITIYKAKGHDAWTRTYKDQRMWDWLLSQKKGAPVPLANKFPSVDGGKDQTIQLPLDSTTITAKASDPDGKISAYIWKKLSGPGLTMSNVYSSFVKLSNLVAGNYKFLVIAKDDELGSNFDEVLLTVKPKDCGQSKPETPLILFDGTDILESSVEAENYHWFSNNEEINANSKQIKITDLNAGYSLSVEINGCISNLSSTFIPSGTEDELADEIEIYPNPSSQSFFLKLSALNLGGMVVTAMDLTGKILKTKRFSPNQLSKKMEIDFHDTPKGIYIIKIWIGNRVVVKRIEKI